MNADNDDLVEHEAKDYSNVGPPGFYEADIEKYYAKFDASRRERHDFKQRMKGKITFGNSEWNSNVQAPGTSHGHRKSKQAFNAFNGTR